MTSEPTQTEELLADTLGDLQPADADTRTTVLAYVRELGSRHPHR